MKDRIYTVEQVAELLDLHPKTVRRFIKDGKLRANKIGNQWRVTATDLHAFTTGENLNDLSSAPCSAPVVSNGSEAGNLSNLLEDSTSSKSPSRIKAQVTSIVDVYVENKEEADRIANTLLAVMLGKDPAYGLAKFDHLFYESEMKVKLILHGQPALISKVLEIIAQIVD